MMKLRFTRIFQMAFISPKAELAMKPIIEEPIDFLN